jgi:ABC-type dipeptide/oligopeptide/nickel transport system ATPase component
MGRRGCGKSYLAKKIQEMWPKRVIIDSLREYSDGIIVRNFDDFCAQMELFKKNNTPKFNLIFQFPPGVIANIEIFNQILKVCYHFRNIQVVIEEIQKYSSPHQLPTWLEECVFTGRHANMSLLFTTQRPGMVNKGILSQCAHIFIGPLTDGNDLRYVSAFLNEETQKLVSIPERQFIYFKDGDKKQISNNF